MYKRQAKTLTELEDIYRPYKQHRKTRASAAREKGLEPLAALLLEQKENYGKTIEEIAKEYMDEEKEVNSAEDALAGARDIIAEDISDSADYRREIRAITWRAGSITTKQIKEGSSPYENYYDYTEKLSSIPNHRILAVNRAEKEEYIRVSVTVEPVSYTHLDVYKRQHIKHKIHAPLTAFPCLYFLICFEFLFIQSLGYK